MFGVGARPEAGCYAMTDRVAAKRDEVIGQKHACDIRPDQIMPEIWNLETTDIAFSKPKPGWADCNARGSLSRRLL